MKFRALNIAKFKRNIMHILAMGQTLLVLSLLSIVFFVLLGISGIAEKHLNTSPVSSMKGLASSLSSHFFINMIGMELPHSTTSEEGSVFDGKKIANVVFQMLTDVNPSDPKSLLAREIPALGADSPILLRAGSGNDGTSAPEDYRTDETAPHDIGQQSEVDPSDPTSPTEPKDPQGNSQPNKEPNTSPPGKTDPTSPEKDPNQQEVKLTGKNIVMIYHSHPQESYNPLIGKESKNPGSSNPKKNIAVVGDMLKTELERNGIDTLHKVQDYASTVSNYNYNYSYKYSRETVKKAMAENGQLEYFIDIHRDSQRHGKTTTTINGENYAQVYFIIGHGNKNWRKNEQFASSIHERMEKDYPGLSRGIWGKTSSQGNGEYNQSLSENSILIEIGGIDNSKEELARTTKVLADILSNIFWEAQDAKKVDGKGK